jgi:hypothetical protein
MKEERILQMGTDKIILMYVTRLSWSDSLTSEWEDGFQLEEKGGRLVHSSETNEGIRAGVYGYDRKKRFSFNLGQYTTKFQAEVHAFKECAVENADEGHENRNICILSES